MTIGGEGGAGKGGKVSWSLFSLVYLFSASSPSLGDPAMS